MFVNNFLMIIVNYFIFSFFRAMRFFASLKMSEEFGPPRASVPAKLALS